MKKYLWTLLFIGLGSLVAQPASSEARVEATIESFFVALGSKDTAALRAMMAPQMVMQTVSVPGEGDLPRLNDGSAEAFLNGLAAAKDRSLEEQIDGLKIKVDGPLAHAWMDYRFYLDGNLHHCGANSFTLFYNGTQWEIIHVIDTRRADCE